MPEGRLDRLEAHLQEVDARLAFLTMRVDALQAERLPQQLPANPSWPAAPAANVMPPSPATAALPRTVKRPSAVAVHPPQPSSPATVSAPAMMASELLSSPSSQQTHPATVSWLKRVLDPRYAIYGPAPTGDTVSPQQKHGRSPASWQELERAISERGLALAGGLALLIGAMLFFSLAISRGWIGPEARVALGLLGGFGLALLGDRLLPTRNRMVGAVLVAVGIGVWQLALVAGTRLYEVVPMWAALPGMVAAAAVATAFAIRTNAQVIALYGLGTALAAPLLFGLPDSQIPMLYVVLMVAAIAAIALARGWAGPPWLAFVLSTYQFTNWAWPSTGPSPATASLWLVGLTVLHSLAAAGMELRTPARHRYSAPLLLAASGGVYLSLILALRWQEAGPWLLAGAIAFVLLGTACQKLMPVTFADDRRGFARTAFALAVLQVTTAVPLLADGPVTEWLWAVEALILLWLATHFRERFGLLGAAIVFSLAALTAYGRAVRTEAVTLPGLPFVSPALLTLLVFLAVLGVAGVIRHATVDRRVLLAIAILLVTVALPLHVVGVGLVVGWAALAVLATAGERLLPSSDATGTSATQRMVDLAVLPGAGLLTAVLAIARAVTFEMPLFVSWRPLDTAYSGQPVMATLALVAAAVAVVAISQHAWVRQLAIATGIGVLAWAAAFALPDAQTVVAWALLAILAERIRQRLADGGPLLLGLSGVLLSLGTAVTLALVAPLRGLAVSTTAASAAPGDALLALGALAAATMALAWGLRTHQAGTWLASLAATLLIYAVSLSVVASFQRNVSPENLDELHRQAHMALSVTWAVIGGLLLGAGVVRAQPFLRWYGLGLLGLATAKVFLYDLNSLDAIYRVLSFLVLGIVLLACATVYRRLDRGPGASAS